MKDINEGLNYLLAKYHICGKGRIVKEALKLETSGNAIPLLPWRNERRFIELKGLAHNGTLESISVMRVCRMEKEGTDLQGIIYRELDLCEWILGSSIESIFTMQNGNKAANIIARLKSGVVCTIEAAATLSKESSVIDKHEIISQRGVACDRVVDTQVPQQSIYVFTDKKQPDAYLDVDFELYGYNHEDVAIVRQAFEVMKAPQLADALTNDAAHLHTLLEMSQKSARNSCNVLAEEEI